MTSPRFTQSLPVWIKIGLLSFGGPAGQIALMQDEVVTRRNWVASDSFDRGLAFSMMLPGPEAQQLATWLGWRIGGVAGGMAAGLAFIVPGAALMILLAWIAAAYGDVPVIAALFTGVQPVVIALVIAAMSKIAGRALNGPAHWILAAVAFIAIYLFGVPFPIVVATAAAVGLLLPHEDTAAASLTAGRATWRHAGVTLLIAAVLIGAVWILNNAVSTPGPLHEVPVLFTTAALVTFGGAYAVLPFVAAQAVETYGWLSAAAMLNGLAIAEATPGPLILVNTYAGFYAGWSTQPDIAAGAYAAAMATFFTFAPSFALILAFAPAVESLYDIPWARRALAGVSAAVVGVIANLVLYLAEASFLPMGLTQPEWAKIALFVAALPCVFILKLGMLALVCGGLAAGLVLHLAGVL
ncbi:MAG: chromate efflux transporter [Pseudomonadota bacterium]